MGILCLMLLGWKRDENLYQPKRFNFSLKKKLQIKTKIKLKDFSQSLLLTDLTPD